MRKPLDIENPVCEKGVTQGETDMTYTAYETQNGKATRALRTGTYEEMRAWANKQEAKNYAQTQVHNPIWVDSVIHSVPR